MTVTVVTLGPTALGAMAASPLIIVGIMLLQLPAQHLTARFAGIGMGASGWLVFGIAEAVARTWWVAGLDTVMLAWWLFVALTVVRASRKYQATGEGRA